MPVLLTLEVEYSLSEAGSIGVLRLIVVLYMKKESKKRTILPTIGASASAVEVGFGAESIGDMLNFE